MKSKYKIIISISVILLLSVSSLIVYFIYTKKQDVNQWHIICYSYNKNCSLDFGYVKNAKVANYSMNYRQSNIKVPDNLAFIENNVKTHENYKFSRLDIEGNEEIILVKDSYVFTLIYDSENDCIIMYDNFGNCNDHLFPYFRLEEYILSIDENENIIYEEIITYVQLNYSIFEKKYAEDIFTNYETIKQFYINNYEADKFICDDIAKTIRLKVIRWHERDAGWSTNYPIEIQCRENDIFVQEIEDVIWKEDIEEY